MIEVIKHVLGFCGEHWHLNIWTAFAASPAVLYFVNSFKNLTYERKN